MLPYSENIQRSIPVPLSAACPKNVLSSLCQYALSMLLAVVVPIIVPLLNLSGYYPRSGFMHIDLGPARTWGDKFPARAVPFALENPPVREALAESRTLRGTGAAGVATIGAAGVEVAQEVLAEAQGAILPLMPYLDSLRWLFIALSLGGIAVAVWARVDDWKKGHR